MTKVFLALGSNLGNRHASLEKAMASLKKIKGIQSVLVSPVYETEPMGGPAGQEKYLNAAAQIETVLLPKDLLVTLLAIEKKLGRERSEKNAPRTIDLDILFYGDQIIHEPGLTVPHPKLHEREFVLKPLADLVPDFVHPVLKKNVKDLLSSLAPSAKRVA